MDTLSREERSARMSRVRGKDTRPEMVVRRMMHSMGLRYRLHVRRLPGSPDIVLPRHRAVVLVHGCFWHRHEDPECKLARLPKSRLEFWLPKLDANHSRDQQNQQRLRDLGWRTLVVWECELVDREAVRAKLCEFLAVGG